MTSRLHGTVAGAALVAIVSLPALAAKCPVARTAVETEVQAVQMARQVVVGYRLVSKPLYCYEFDVYKDAPDFRPEEGYQFDVRLAHQPGCGGDPELAPRLLSLRVYRDGRFLTDDAEGRFAEPTCPGAGQRAKRSAAGGASQTRR